MTRKVTRTALAEATIQERAVDFLAFEDLQLFQDLCGPHDASLMMIENAFGVRIDPKGNRLALHGADAARRQSLVALQRLQGRLEEGLSVRPGDVEAVIRLAKAHPKNMPHKPSKTSIISLQKRTITPRSAAQEAYLTAMRDQELVFGVGPAGTGKTYLAVAWAAHLLLRGEVERIILSRPALEAGERIGFLPGDMKEKVDPYLRPLYDALYDVLHGDFVDRRLEAGEIEIAPLGFMRGRTLSRAAIILDEAQNATVAQMKMFLTRLGEGARMVITGDPSQSDLPVKETSGLGDALHLLGGVKGVAVARFAASDVVRHKLVARIVNAYDQRDQQARAKVGAK